MNKMKLHAKLIDMGVVEESDVVVIKESTILIHSHYITVVSCLNEVASYIYQNNELVMIEGSANLSNVLRMKDLDLEEFE